MKSVDPLKKFDALPDAAAVDVRTVAALCGCERRRHMGTCAARRSSQAPQDWRLDPLERGRAAQGVVASERRGGLNDDARANEKRPRPREERDPARFAEWQRGVHAPTALRALQGSPA